MIGWIGDYKNDSDAGEYEWGGTLSMPRELYADAAGQLYQRPVREVVRLFDRTALREKRVGLNTRYDLPEIRQQLVYLQGELAALDTGRRGPTIVLARVRR